MLFVLRLPLLNRSPISARLGIVEEEEEGGGPRCGTSKGTVGRGQGKEEGRKGRKGRRMGRRRSTMKRMSFEA
jgi:hypothetical protein